MNKDMVQGGSKQLSGKFKKKLGQLTDDALKKTEGNVEHFLGRLQEKYGIAKDKAAQQLKDLDLH